MREYKICFVLLLWLQLFSSLGRANDSDLDNDPFELEEYMPIVPRKSSSYGKNHTTEKELMVAHMAMSYELFKNLSLTKRDFSKIPETQVGDEVYELTHLFPNCEGEDDLWVVYNESASKIIAQADSLLRSSVNDYVQRVSEVMPKRVKFSLTYIDVDRAVPLELEALKKADYNLLMKRSGEVGSADRNQFCNEDEWLEIEPIISGGEYLIYILGKLSLSENDEIDVQTCFRLGERLIYELGDAEGNRKRVLLAEVDVVDMSGRGTVKSLEKNGRDEVNKLGEDVTSLLGHVNELSELLGHKKEGLIAIPEWMEGSVNDVVYDLTKMFFNTGIRFGEDEWIFHNRTTDKYYFKGTWQAYEQMKELVGSLLISYPTRVKSRITFYEVDSIIQPGEEWDILTLLSANPELLGRVGCLTGNAEISEFRSALGNSSITVSGGELGECNYLNFNSDLTLKGRVIKAKFVKAIKRDALGFIVLGEGITPSRKIVMMVEIDAENMKYKALKQK